jgi:hypothetical protein
VERDLSQDRGRLLEQQAETVDKIRTDIEARTRLAMTRTEDPKARAMLQNRLNRVQTLRAVAQGSKLGANDGTRALYNPAEVASLATARKGTAAAHLNRTHGQTISVLQSVRDNEVRFVPAKLFEMWEQWKGNRLDTTAFQTAVHALHRQECERADEAKGAQDFWCCESCFIDARTKDIRK